MAITHKTVNTTAMIIKIQNATIEETCTKKILYIVPKHINITTGSKYIKVYMVERAARIFHSKNPCIDSASSHALPAKN
jgi:hypothetical protein